MKKQLLRILVFQILLFSPGPLLAFSSPNVPINDPVYRDLDKLISFGLIKDAIYGQRPWSRDEIARLIGEAMKNPEPPSATTKIIKRLQQLYQEELAQKAMIFHPLHSIQTRFTFLHSQERPLTAELGNVNASVEPLSSYEEGRNYSNGFQESIETEHFATSRYFSFYAHPRLQQATPLVQQLYAKFTTRPLELEVGRDSLEWGQGATGGILLTNNARSFDMIKLANPSPLLLPSLFQYLGPFRYTFFVANLGPGSEFPYSYLTGLKLSFKPVSFFEFGAAQILVLGGEGAPGPLTVGNVIQEFVGLRPGDPYTTNLSNRELGFDGRLYLPMFRNAQIYLDVQFEDKEAKQIAYMFSDLASYHAGFYLPRLDSEGQWDLRLEYKHFSPYFYRHGIFSDGMTLDGHLWGDPLGPQNDAASVGVSCTVSPKLTVGSLWQYIRNGGNILGEAKNPDLSNRHLFVITSRPAETRWVWVLTNQYFLNSKIRFVSDLGYERIEAYNFVAGDDRNAFFMRVGLDLYLF